MRLVCGDLVGGNVCVHLTLLYPRSSEIVRAYVCVCVYLFVRVWVYVCVRACACVCV